MSKYGNVFSVSDYASALKKSNRNYSGLKTWNQMYAATDLAALQAEGAVKYNYAQNVADAYYSSEQQRRSIGASELGTGYKKAAIQDIDAALNEAYDTYYNNYVSNMASIQEAQAQAQAQTTELLNTQAEYTKQYEEAHINYVKDLWSKTETGELTMTTTDEDGNVIEGDLPANFFSEGPWSKLTKIDADGNRVLLSDDEIRSLMYDANGNLTIAGLDIYDMIENDLAQRGKFSFGSYLAQQDEANDTDLVDWAMSYNPFDYSVAGTNAGSFKELVGMASTDDKYSFVERFGGMNEDEINAMMDPFVVKIQDIRQLVNDGADIDDIVENVKQFSTDIFKMFDEYGLIEDFKQAGYDIDTLTAAITNSLSNYETAVDDLSTYDANTTAIAEGTRASTAAGYMAVGASVGSLPGAIIGFIIGAIGGSFAADAVYNSRNMSADRRNKVSQVSTTKDVMFDDMLNVITMITMYAQQKRRATENKLQLGK